MNGGPRLPGGRPDASLTLSPHLSTLKNPERPFCSHSSASWQPPQRSRALLGILPNLASTCKWPRRDPSGVVTSVNRFQWHLRLLNSHSGTAHGLSCKTTPSFRDTETLLAPATPATRTERAELGAGRWPPLNLCQWLKLVSEETEIVHFLSL